MIEITDKLSAITDRVCGECGKTYRNIYKQSGKYQYSLPTTYCSKSCASKSRIKSNPGSILTDPGKDVIQKEILDFIESEGRYCTRKEICSGINRSSKTVNKHRISTPELNKTLGFNRKGSIFQSKVEKILRSEFSEIEVEKSFDGMVGNTGYPLRVDFFIPSLNVVVEADGSQHHSEKHPWHSFKNGTVAEYDKIKEDFLKENGIRLVRVRYEGKLEPEMVLSEILET